MTLYLKELYLSLQEVKEVAICRRLKGEVGDFLMNLMIVTGLQCSPNNAMEVVDYLPVLALHILNMKNQRTHENLVILA